MWTIRLGKIRISQGVVGIGVAVGPAVHREAEDIAA